MSSSDSVYFKLFTWRIIFAETPPADVFSGTAVNTTIFIPIFTQ